VHRLDPRTLQGAAYTEGQQLELLREQLDTTNKIHSIEQQNLQDRFSGFKDVFGGGKAVDAVQNAAEKYLIDQHKKFTADLLRQMLDQQHLLNQIKQQQANQPR
jgi:hypothetical protein